MNEYDITRRDLCKVGVGALTIPVVAGRAAAQAIEDVFRAGDDPRHPDDNTYDLFAWSGTGYLFFRDGENDIARWGDDSPPPADPVDEGNAAGGNDLWDDLVSRDDLHDTFVRPANLYTSYITPSSMSEAISLMFIGIVAGFGYFSVKLRSLLIGLGWMFLVISFALAILVDTSLIYFWLAVIFTSVMVVVALADGVLRE